MSRNLPTFQVLPHLNQEHVNIHELEREPFYNMKKYFIMIIFVSSTAPMNQSYQSSYGGMQSQPMESMGSGMMSQSYNQSYPSSQNPSMMPSMQPQQPSYMSQPAQPAQQPYNVPTSRSVHSNCTYRAW